MPTHTSNRKRGKAGLALAPAVPLAIALIHGALIPPKPGGALIESPNEEELVAQPVKCEEPLEGFEACHSKYPAGCSTGGKYDPYLNLLKNQTSFTGAPVRFLSSQSDFVALEKKIPSDLGKDNHADDKDALAQAGEGKLHGVIGYLYDAKAEDKESSNCELPRDTPPDDVDFHIWVGFDSAVGQRLRQKGTATSDEKKTAAIVEMTPHTRHLRSDQDGWTIDSLTAARGHKVRVIGQLMVDNEHNVSSQNCGHDPHTSACWRLSVWELHPITQFQVCGAASDDACTETSDNWIDLGATQGEKTGGSSPGKKGKTTASGI